MKRLRAALAEIASMRGEGLLTDQEAWTAICTAICTAGAAQFAQAYSNKI